MSETVSEIQEGIKVSFSNGWRNVTIEIDDQNLESIVLSFITHFRTSGYQIFEDFIRRFIPMIQLVKRKYDVNYSAQLSTKIFEILTPAARAIPSFSWGKIYSIIEKIETQNSIQFHKGSLYYFYAKEGLEKCETDLGVCLLYQALLEDQEIEKQGGICVIEQPAYKTLTFAEEGHLLQNWTRRFREDLELIVVLYNSEFSKELSIHSVKDSLFSDKKTLFCWYALISVVLRAHNWYSPI